MTTELKLRRGTTTQHSSFTGANGEVTVDTDKDTLVVHDGSTAGGHPVAKESRQITGTGGLEGGGSLAADRTIGIADGGVTTAKVADGAVTTAKIGDAQVTGAKLASGAAAANIGSYVSTVNGQAGDVVVSQITPSSATPLIASGSGSAGTATTYARGDHVHPEQTFNGVTSLFGSTGAIQSGGITAGTTYTLFDSSNTGGASAGDLNCQSGSYPDWQNHNFDTGVRFTDAGGVSWGSISASVRFQLSFIALNAGTYRVTYDTDNGTSTTNISRILVNGVEQYAVTHGNTTQTTRTVDITLNPFDTLTIQMRRSAGSGNSWFSYIRIQSSNGGTLLRRGVL